MDLDIRLEEWHPSDMARQRGAGLAEVAHGDGPGRHVGGSCSEGKGKRHGGLQEEDSR